MVRYSVGELKAVVPDESVKARFLTRDDIIELPPEEQERRWAEHSVKLDEFWARIASLDTTVIF